MTASAANPTDSIPDEQVFNGTNDGQIQVWERGAYPLRTDDTGAATAVPLPGAQGGGVFGEELPEGADFNSTDQGINSRNLVSIFGTEKNPAGVHDSGSIDISFDASRAESNELNGQNRVDFYAARVTGEGGEGFPDDYSDAVTLYGSVENANANLSFDAINEDEPLQSDGTYDTSYDFSPGHWIVYAVVNNGTANGFEIDNNNQDNITVDGDVVIVGADIVSVHEAESDVTEPESLISGNTAEFVIRPGSGFSGQAEQVTHTVALYKKNMFEESRFDIVTNTSKFGPDFNASNGSQLEHSIANVEGVADVDSGITINGQDLSDGRLTASGNLGLGAIIDRFAEDLGTNDPATDPIDPINEEAVINASVTAKSSQNVDSGIIQVDTLQEWDPGTYQWIAVSQPDDDSTSMSTETGTLVIDEPDIRAPAASVGPSSTKTFNLKGLGSSKLDKVKFTPGNGVTVTVSQLNDIPSDTTTDDVRDPLSSRNVNQVVLSIDISLNTSSDGTVELTIPRSAFNDGNPSDLRVTKYNELLGEYDKTDYDITETTADNVTIEFTSSSFSTFVVTRTSEVTSDDGGTTGGGGGGGGGASEEQVETTVESTKQETEGGETATATIPDAEAGETVSVNTDTSSDDGAVTVDSVNIEFAEETGEANVQVSTTSANNPPEGAPEPDPGQTGDAIGYVETTVEGADDNSIGRSTFNFRVSDQRLEQTGTSPENVVLYRVVDGEPTPLPTEHRGGNSFVAETDGFSVFVIGTTGVDISVASGELDATTVDPGEAFTASVTLRNDGGSAGDVELTLAADGDTLATQTVTVAPEEQTQVDLTGSIDQAGTYDITVNGNSIGTLEVVEEGEAGTPEGTATPGPGETPEGPGEGTPAAEGTPTPETDGIFGPGFGIIVALLALLGASLIALRRRQ